MQLHHELALSIEASFRKLEATVLLGSRHSYRHCSKRDNRWTAPRRKQIHKRCVLSAVITANAGRLFIPKVIQHRQQVHTYTNKQTRAYCPHWHYSVRGYWWTSLGYALSIPLQCLTWKHFIWLFKYPIASKKRFSCRSMFLVISLGKEETRKKRYIYSLFQVILELCFTLKSPRGLLKLMVFGFCPPFQQQWHRQAVAASSLFIVAWPHAGPVCMSQDPAVHPLMAPSDWRARSERRTTAWRGSVKRLWDKKKKKTQLLFSN